ncbi:MAG: TRAP transporter substrate-binding protein [Gammaproteobacteria bacterium]|nr:TRAP transporter substrate-binding protein [Gammaproteobacteria bacterium]
MRNKLVGLLLTAATATAFSGSSMAADKVLTFSHWAGPKHSMASAWYPWYSEQLSECSGGSLTVKMENGLAPPPAQYDTIRDGVADIGWIVHGYTKGKFLTTKLLELPGLAGNAESMSVAFQMAHEKYFAAAKEAKGVVVMGKFVHGPGMINTAEKITSYKQVEGMKLRVGGGVANEVGSALGVAGVNMPAPSVYEAIASGVAEGVFFPAETLYSFKIDELTKFSFKNPDGMYTTSFALIMNQDSYDDLSDEHKACVDKFNGVEMSRTIGQFWDEADTIGITESAKTGSVIIEASDEERAYFKEKTAGIEAKVIAEVESRGVDAKAALEFIRSQLQ